MAPSKCWWLIMLLVQMSVDGGTISHLPPLHRILPSKLGVRCQSFNKVQNIKSSTSTSSTHQLISSIRGGAHENKKSISGTISSAINDITPTTRVYLFGCLIMAALTLCGVPEEFLLFEPRRTFLKGQIWRPFTSSCYLGKVDMSMLSQIYFLVNYGQEMERHDGSAQFGFFLFVQMTLLMFFSLLIGSPSLSRSLISSAIYTCSRRDPSRLMEIQFGIRVEYWLLPYINMMIDCLQGQSIAAALPHILGILTGHIYHFYSIIWPKMGGKKYMKIPKFIEEKFLNKKSKKNNRNINNKINSIQTKITKSETKLKNENDEIKKKKKEHSISSIQKMSQMFQRKKNDKINQNKKITSSNELKLQEKEKSESKEETEEMKLRESIVEKSPKKIKSNKKNNVEISKKNKNKIKGYKEKSKKTSTQKKSQIKTKPKPKTKPKSKSNNRA